MLNIDYKEIINKNIGVSWSFVKSFPGGFITAAVLANFFLMDYQEMYHWAVKSNMTKKELVRNAFSKNSEELIRKTEKIRTLELKIVSFKNEIISINNSKKSIETSTNELRLIYNSLLQKNYNLNKILSESREKNTKLIEKIKHKEENLSQIQKKLRETKTILAQEKLKSSQIDKQLIDEKQSRHDTQELLSKEQKHRIDLQRQLKNELTRRYIPLGHIVGENGIVRNKDDQPVCKEVVVEPTKIITNENGDSTTNFGIYRKDCLMDNGEWLPYQTD